MDILNTVTAGSDAGMILAIGAAAGCILCAGLSALLPEQRQKTELARRVARLEMRLAASRNLSAVATALSGLQSAAPVLVEAAPRMLLADARLRSLGAASNEDTDDIARAFGEALQGNTVAAVEIARAIIDQSVNLNDPKDRKRVAEKVRGEARNLSTTFWDSHGQLLLSSGLPANLKELLRVFFVQVKRLKTAVDDLVKEPSFADLDAVLDHAIHLIDTARSIIDTLETLGGE
jgi:hypothetical protein